MHTGIRAAEAGLKGALNRLLGRNLERLLALSGGKLYRRYTRAAQDVTGAQARLLDDILGYAKDTVFGREHGFADISDYTAYRERVPVGDYEDHRPYVDRHVAGEQDVLFPGRPLLYTLSSGTTAQAKLIPITPFNFERTIKSRGKLWLHSLARHYPGVYSGKALALVSPAEEGRTADGTPFGSLSGLIYKNIPGFMRAVHTQPYEVMTIPDFEAKAYTVLRFAVPQDVTSLFTGNPATVLNLAAKADLWKEQLIRDVRDGTLRQDIALDPALRTAFEARFEPAPERAAELERAAAGERFRPVDYWPNLKLVHTWKNGNCRLVLPQLEPWLDERAPILDFGYIASEINATDIIDPANDGSLLAVGSAFYEFAPVVDGGEPGNDFLLAHELEEGRRYFIYVTTLSGLYRYDMNDVVEVVGHYHQAPVLRFLYKGKGITNLQGEKLSEAQFIEAMSRATEATGLTSEFFVGLADAEANRYRLYVGFDRDHPTEQTDAFAAEVDRALKEVNVEYEAKRRSERLDPPTMELLGPDAFARYRALRLSEGAHEGQLKWLNLSSTEADRARLVQLVRERAATDEE